MRQVKGTIFLMVVKAIRSDKSGQYDTILSDKDKDIVFGRILPSIWYPFENYKNCLNALIQVEARGNMEICVEWGRRDVANIMKGFYSSSIVKGDIKATIEKFNLIFKLLFDFSEIRLDFIRENELNLTLINFDPDFKGFYYIGRGWVEKLIEFSIDTTITSKFIKKSWEGDDETIMNFSWSN